MVLGELFDMLQEIHEEMDVDLDEEVDFHVDGNPVKFQHLEVDDAGSLVVNLES